jgi:hypothetical protein
MELIRDYCCFIVFILVFGFPFALTIVYFKIDDKFWHLEKQIDKKNDNLERLIDKSNYQLDAKISRLNYEIDEKINRINLKK